MNERRVLQLNLISASEETSILPQDTREYARPIQALAETSQNSLIARALMTALHRFRSTENIQDVSNSIQSVCDAESERLDYELVRIDNCTRFMQRGFTIRPKSRFESLCSDVVPIAVLANQKQPTDKK